jgi:predicted RNase H-like HicB family nuclease
MQLTVRLLRETDGRWIADVPELPGVTVYGSNREEATLKAKALALRVIAEEMEHGEMKPAADQRAADVWDPIVGAKVQ